MPKGIKAMFKGGKLKILDETGQLIDSIRPLDVEDTLDILQLKFGKKKR